MIFRALIAIGIVSLLTPHEPDLGFGRPGAGASHPSPASLLPTSGLSRKQDCSIPACAGALAFTSALGLTPPAGRNLNDVKAEIEADMKSRES